MISVIVLVIAFVIVIIILDILMVRTHQSNSKFPKP